MKFWINIWTEALPLFFLELKNLNENIICCFWVFHFFSKWKSTVECELQFAVMTRGNIQPNQFRTPQKIIFEVFTLRIFVDTPLQIFCPFPFVLLNQSGSNRLFVSDLWLKWMLQKDLFQHICAWRH